jgi:hypothetical protein
MDFKFNSKIAIGNQKKADRKELQRTPDNITGSVNREIAKGTGVLDGEIYRDHRFDFHVVDASVKIVDHGTKQDIFRLDLREPHSIIILGERELAFYTNDNYLVASIPNDLNEKLGRRAEIKAKQISSNFLPLGSIYLCKHVTDGACVLYVNEGVLFEQNVNGDRNLDISDLSKVKIKNGDKHHNLVVSTQAKREYTIDSRYSVSLAYNIYYEKYKHYAKQYSYSHFYKIWGKQLNEYILYILFGDILKSYYLIQGHDKRVSGSAKEKELHKVIRLYTEVQALKYKLEYSSLYLCNYLNDYDAQWIREQVPRLAAGRQITSSSFDDLGRTINLVVASLLRYLGEIQRSVSRVERVLQAKEKTLLDLVTQEIGFRAISPIYLLTKAPEIASRILPELINHPEVDKLRGYGPKALSRFSELAEILISPLILEMNKATYQVISKIISRDLKYLKRNKMNGTLKDELVKRYLKLRTLSLKPAASEIDMSVSDIVKIIFDKAKNLDYSSFESMD